MLRHFYPVLFSLEEIFVLLEFKLKHRVRMITLFLYIKWACPELPFLCAAVPHLYLLETSKLKVLLHHGYR